MLLRCVRGVSPASWRAALAGGSVVVLTVLAFLPILLWGGWVWDDLYYVRWNPRLVGGEGLYALWFEAGQAGGRPGPVFGRARCVLVAASVFEPVAGALAVGRVLRNEVSCDEHRHSQPERVAGVGFAAAF